MKYSIAPKRLRQAAFLLCTVLLFSACKSLQVNTAKTTANTKDIGLKWSLNGRINDSLYDDLEQVMLDVVEEFNSQPHAFKVHHMKDRDRDKDYITIDVNQAKIVRGGEKAAGYFITAAGIATPIILLTSGEPYIITFFYWPMHRIQALVDLSPNMAGEKRSSRNVISERSALFSSNKRQVPLMLSGLKKGLMKALLDVEMQLKANEQSGR